MKASDFIAKYLEIRGVRCCFEVVGGMITHLLDSINLQTNIDIISCHHEQAAGFSAEGYSRVSGLPGIALATSGPGATNLLTAIGSCFFEGAGNWGVASMSGGLNPGNPPDIPRRVPAPGEPARALAFGGGARGNQ